jgi:hypothetical protein
MRMKQNSCYFDEETDRQLKTLAQHMKISGAAVLRLVVKKEFENFQKEQKERAHV